MFSFFPKNPAFAPKYHQAVVVIQNMAAVFSEIQTDWEHRMQYRERAEDIEKSGDEVVKDIITALNESFITPFDREDMYMLVDRLDDVADNLLRLMIHSDIYSLSKTRPYMHEFGDLYIETANVLEKIIRHLFDKKTDAEGTEKLLILMTLLSAKSEKYYEDSIRLLFDEEKDAVELIKWDNIIREMYGIMTSFKKVARSVEGILMKVG